MKPIYLDYAATTPIDPRVEREIQASLMHHFGNPASLHSYGKQAKLAIEQARLKVANAISALPEEIIWTSGATESNNLAIKGAARMYQRRGKHIITARTEHKAVLDPCQHLEKEGFHLTYLKPEPTGLIDIEKLKASFKQDTILVSIMLVNNETGVIQDIEAIARETSTRGILLHVDAAQAVGKVAIPLNKLPIDLLSLCAHKVYGPKGIGALYLRKKPRVRVEPLFHGGGHEQGMRSGTLATHQVVGMGLSFQLAEEEREQDYQHLLHCRQQFLDQLAFIPNLKLNINLTDCVPHILNLRFDGMLAEAILAQLPNIATSSGSACLGKGTEGSYVLRAMGLSEIEVKASIRFSFGRFTTLAEIKQACSEIRQLFNVTNASVGGMQHQF